MNLTNKDDHKDNYKEIFEELVKKKIWLNKRIQVKLLYESQQVVIKSFNNYSSIVSEA